LAQRSRKRGRRTKSVARPAAAAARPAETPALRPTAAPAPRRPSAEERNAAVRATLEPLAPGERPWPLVASALLALALVVANLVLVIADVKLKGTKTGAEIAYVVVMGMCTYGLWRARYWAVLGFMVLLVLTILQFAVLLIRASNVLGVTFAVVVVGGGGFLFYKLVRVMSRIQMPRPPAR
jgi:hypothetical protein